MADMTDEEFQAEVDLAKAKARVNQERNTGLATEIQANSSGSPDDRDFAMNPSGPAPSHDERLRAAQAPFSPPNEKGVMLPTDPITLGKGIVKGVANAGIGMVRTAHAVGSAIGTGLGEGYDAVAPSFGFSPRDPASVAAGKADVNATQEMFKGATLQPSNPSETVSMPAAQMATGAALGGPSIIRGGIGAAVANPDQEDLIYGGKGGLGLDPNPNDDEGTAQAKHLINTSLDNITAGAAIAGGTYALKFGKDFIKNIATSFKDWRNVSTIEKEYMSDIVEIGAGIPENATREEKVAALQKANDVYDKYHKQTYDLGEGVGEKTIERDPVSILTKGLQDGEAPNARARHINLESLRASAKTGSTPKTLEVLEQPKKVLDESLGQLQSTRGGDTAIEQTKTNLQGQAHTQAAAADIPPLVAQEELAHQQDDLHNALRADKDFGPRIQQADDAGVKLDIHKDSLDKQTQIVDRQHAAELEDRSTRNTAHSKIPKGTAANMESFGPAYENAKPYLPDYVKKSVEEGDGTYAHLHNEVRPKVSRFINDMQKSPNPEVDMGPVYKLQENIRTEQPLYLSQQGNTVTAKAAQGAVKADKTYGQSHSQGLGQDLKTNAKNTLPTKPNDFVQEGRAKVLSAIKDPNRREDIKQLYDTLKTPQGGQSEHLVADVALAESMMDVTAGKGLTIGDVKSNLQKMASSFDGPQKKRIEGFIADIEKRGMSIDDIKKQIPGLQNAADDAKEQIYMENFEGLFKRASGGRYKGVTNGYRAFQGMLEKGDHEGITSLAKAARESGDPADIKGLQAAWAKAAEEKLGKNSKEIVPFSQEFEAHGREVFGDSPAVDGIRELRKEAERITKAQQKPGVQSFDPNANQGRLTSAVQTISTWMFGVLNPKAARIKTITRQLTDMYDSNPKARQAIDNVLSNNQLLKDHLVKALETAQKSLSPAETKSLQRVFTQVGVGTVRDQTKNATKK